MKCSKVLIIAAMGCMLSSTVSASKSRDGHSRKHHKTSRGRTVSATNLKVRKTAKICGDLKVKGLVSRCPDNNVYWLGDSVSDPGNLKLLRPDLAVNSNTPLPNGEVIMIRFNDTGRNSDGFVHVDFLADTCGYKMSIGSALNSLPKGTGNLVNFAISGASQNNNLFLYLNEEPPPSLSIEFQVAQLCSLLDKKRARFASDDICVIQDTLNDAGIIGAVILDVPGNLDPIPTVDELIAQYIESTISNIDALFQKGCKRLFLAIFDEITPLENPFWEKLNDAFPGILPAIDAIVAVMQSGLRTAIDAKVAADWQDLDVTIVNLTDAWVEILANPNLYGVRQTADNKTMTDLGWPDILAQNVFYFDDAHFTQHSHKILSDFDSNWFAKCDSNPRMGGSKAFEVKDYYMHAKTAQSGQGSA